MTTQLFVLLDDVINPMTGQVMYITGDVITQSAIYQLNQDHDICYIPVVSIVSKPEDIEWHVMNVRDRFINKRW